MLFPFSKKDMAPNLNLDRLRLLKKLNNKLAVFLIVLSLLTIIIILIGIDRTNRVGQINTLLNERINYAGVVNNLTEVINDLKFANDRSQESLDVSRQLIEKQRLYLYFDLLTGKIMDVLNDPTIKYENLRRIVELCYTQTNRYSTGKYNWVDMLALAGAESAFNPKCVGKFDERGVWQILDWKGQLRRTGEKDPANLETNFKMSCRILNDKFSRFKTIKDSIIGYNGYILRDDKTVVDTYWKRFIKYREKINAAIKKAKEDSSWQIEG